MTGTPNGLAASTAAETICENKVCLYGSADPPPRLVTLGTGQPKFKSIWSAKFSSINIFTAMPVTRGSTAYNWTDLGVSPLPGVIKRIVSG